jgi:bifunctional non-homologous end joining protein LigD
MVARKAREPIYGPMRHRGRHAEPEHRAHGLNSRTFMLPVVEPIVPVLSRELPRGREWRFEVKLDGFRGTLYIEDRKAAFRSKTRRVMRRFQDLADRLAKVLDVRSVILDGEILVMGESAPDFGALMQAQGEPEYAAFDLVWLNGRDLRPLPYTKRKARLRKVLAGQTAVAYVEAHRSVDLFEAAARLDLEGVVAKRAGDRYDTSTEWVKVKNRDYTQMEGRWELFEGKR